MKIEKRGNLIRITDKEKGQLTEISVQALLLYEILQELKKMKDAINSQDNINISDFRK